MFAFLGNVVAAVKRCAVAAKDKALAAVAVGTASVASMFEAGEAHAVSVIDTPTQTLITAGFTDMKDTLLALLNVAWPFLIAVPVIMMAPRIVSKIVKMIGRG